MNKLLLRTSRLGLLAWLAAGMPYVQTDSPVGPGWAKNKANGAIFCQNSAIRQGHGQYVAHYDLAGYVTLAKRCRPARPCTPYTATCWHPLGSQATPYKYINLQGKQWKTAFVRPTYIGAEARARSTNAGRPTSAENWKLVWAEEFNQPGRPDPQNWQFEQGFVRNHELQWYQPENAHCENGLLVLEAKKEMRPNPTYEAGSTDWRTSRPTIDYTAASLSTRGQHQWQYGRFEVRARIDTRPGLWPAFWTLGVEKPWPSNGEIDIMEYYKGKILANVASGTDRPHTAKWHSETKPVASFADPEWTSKFHIWRMDWNAQAIRLYVDDLLLNETLLTNTVNQDGTGFNPMMQPHYVLLNLALGGDNGGELPATSLPSRYEIDYVRVYQQ